MPFLKVLVLPEKETEFGLDTRSFPELHGQVFIYFLSYFFILGRMYCEECEEQCNCRILCFSHHLRKIQLERLVSNFLILPLFYKEYSH